MFKFVTSGFIVSVFFLFGSVAQAQTTDITDALKRIDALIAEMQTIRAELAKVTGAGSVPAAPTVLGASASPVFTESLKYGETNDDIRRIQKLLATDPEVYPYGVASGFFGPKTQEAIRNLQKRFGLDPVGVIGPATTALLELFMKAYPDGNYPVGVLQKKPTVLGATTTGTPTTPIVPTYTGVNPAKSISVAFDEGESLITIVYTNGNRKGLIANTTKESEVIAYIVSKTPLTQPQVSAVIDFGKKTSSSSSRDYDEEDAEDALDDAEDAIRDAEDEIEEADDDGDDVDWAEDTLDDARDLFDDAEQAYDDEDWDEAVELADEAENLANKAVDRIDKEKGSEQGDPDEIDSIEVEVDEDESEVTVEYEDGNEYVFTVDEDKESQIIEAIADELDMDEDDVEDLISFDFGSVRSIDVRVGDTSTLAIVTYRSGVDRRVRISSTKTSTIISKIADAIDEDEEDVEEWATFD